MRDGRRPQKPVVNSNPVSINPSFCVGARPGFGLSACIGCIMDGEGAKSNDRSENIWTGKSSRAGERNRPGDRVARWIVSSGVGRPDSIQQAELSRRIPNLSQPNMRSRPVLPLHTQIFLGLADSFL